MRVLAIVMVLLGCLGLARYGWRTAHPEAAPAAAAVSPAVAGIVVVGGLLLLVTGTRRRIA